MDASALFSPCRRSSPSCDLKQRKYLADLQPSSGSDSSVAAGRIRRINRKKSVTLKASVCVWYWLGHAPVDLYPLALRYSSWGSPRGLCTSGLISFAFVEQRGKIHSNIISSNVSRNVTYRACSFLSSSALTKTRRRSRDSEQHQVAFIAALLPKPSGV